MIIPTLIVCSESTYDVEFQHLMRGVEGLLTENLPKIDWLKPAQLQLVVRLERLASFKGLSRALQENKVDTCPIYSYDKSALFCFQITYLPSDGVSLFIEGS